MNHTLLSSLCEVRGVNLAQANQHDTPPSRASRQMSLELTVKIIKGEDARRRLSIRNCRCPALVALADPCTARAQLLACDKAWGALMGPHTSSDPFVTISLGDPNEKQLVHDRQTTVKKETLNPEWDEIFTVRTSESKIQMGAFLVLRIYDEDDLGPMKQPDVMGQVYVKLSDLTDAEKQFTQEVDVNPQKPIGFSGRPRKKGFLTFTASIAKSGPHSPARRPEGAPPPPGGDAAVSTTALDSAELRSLAKILEIQGKLSADGINVKAPKVAVVGGQSAGKYRQPARSRTDCHGVSCLAASRAACANPSCLPPSGPISAFQRQEHHLQRHPARGRLPRSLPRG